MAADLGPGRFHAHGWVVHRLDDGSVRFECVDTPGKWLGTVVEFDPDTWASLVAHVADGGSPAAHEAAVELHRSAVSGRFVSGEFAEQHPDTTVTEHD